MAYGEINVIVVWGMTSCPPSLTVTYSPSPNYFDCHTFNKNFALKIALASSSHEAWSLNVKKCWAPPTVAVGHWSTIASGQGQQATELKGVYLFPHLCGHSPGSIVLFICFCVFFFNLWLMLKYLGGINIVKTLNLVWYFMPSASPRPPSCELRRGQCNIIALGCHIWPGIQYYLVLFVEVSIGECYNR